MSAGRPPISMQDARAVAGLLDEAAGVMRAHPTRRGSSVRLGRAGRIVLTGDMHDNPVHFEVTRQLARLEDSPDHHLVLHELIHGDRLVSGVDLSYRILCKAAGLVLDHPGQVHIVLANHELAQAFRHPVTKGAGDNLELFDLGLDWAFGDDAAEVEEAIGRFVRALPLAVRCANGLMLSHSLPSPLDLPGFDLGVLDRPLVDADYQLWKGAAWQMVWGRGWDRTVLTTLAEAWGVRTFVLGHAYVETGAEAQAANLLALNSDHDAGRVVTVDLAEDCPDAFTLLSRCVPLSAYAGSGG